MREYVWLGLMPVAFIDHSSGSAVTYYMHVDQVVNPQKLTDGSGLVVWDRVADPFGVEIAATGSLTQRLRFPGQYADDETDLFQNWNRDYDPSLGRYVQSDPIGLLGGINTYAYVEGNPLKFVDPKGLQQNKRFRDCDKAEIDACYEQCTPRGIESCKVPQTFRITRIKEELVVREWVDGPMSCSCNDPDDNICRKSPAVCLAVVSGVCILLATPIPDDVLIPPLIGAAGLAGAAGSQ